MARGPPPLPRDSTRRPRHPPRHSRRSRHGSRRPRPPAHSRRPRRQHPPRRLPLPPRCLRRPSRRPRSQLPRPRQPRPRQLRVLVSFRVLGFRVFGSRAGVGRFGGGLGGFHVARLVTRRIGRAGAALVLGRIRGFLDRPGIEHPARGCAHQPEIVVRGGTARRVRVGGQRPDGQRSVPLDAPQPHRRPGRAGPQHQQRAVVRRQGGVVVDADRPSVQDQPGADEAIRVFAGLSGVHRGGGLRQGVEDDSARGDAELQCRHGVSNREGRDPGDPRPKRSGPPGREGVLASRRRWCSPARRARRRSR